MAWQGIEPNEIASLIEDRRPFQWALGEAELWGAALKGYIDIRHDAYIREAVSKLETLISNHMGTLTDEEKLRFFWKVRLLHSIEASGCKMVSDTSGYRRVLVRLKAFLIEAANLASNKTDRTSWAVGEYVRSDLKQLNERGIT